MPSPESTPGDSVTAPDPDETSPDSESLEGALTPPSGEIVRLPERVQDVPERDRGPLTGRLIQGRYLIKGLIGEGGMGAVYRAEHTLMGKDLAIKVLLPEFGTVEGLAKRFQQEAQSASRLEHPGIIQVYDFGHTEEGQLFLVMAYLDGPSLTSIIHREAPLPPERAIPIAVQMCEALAHAHEQGVVHRDMKPDNVIVVQRDGIEVVKLPDFGIARVTQGEGAAKGMTEVGMVFGTPEYISPEQAAGDPADARSDLYAVGAILYEMLAGRKVFLADTQVRYITQHMSTQPLPFAESAPGVAIPAALEQVVMTALAKSPAKRYATGRDFAEALLSLQLVNYASPSALTSVPTIPPATQRRVAAASGATPSLPPGASAAGEGATSTVPPVTHTLPPGAHDSPAVNRAIKVWGLVALGVILFLMVVLLAVIVGSDDDSSRGGRGAKAAPSVKKSLDVEAELQAVQGLIAAGKLEDAEKRLQVVVRKAPRNPRVHLFQGHLNYLRGRREASLGSYQSAILLDGTVREDEVLCKDLAAMLRRKHGRQWGRADRKATVDFITGGYAGSGPLGDHARTLLTDWVNEWWEPDLVSQVIDMLARKKADEDVDYVHAYKVRFKGVRSCEKRKVYVREIMKRGDRSFLPLLREIHQAASFKMPYSKVRVPNDCIRSLVDEAILKLGGTIPDPPAPTMTVRSRRRTSRPRPRHRARRRRRRRR